MMNPRLHLFPLLLLAALTGAGPPPDREIRLHASVDPAFRITPLVQHFDAPRGRRLAFEFTVETVAKPTSLRILPIAMRQEDNGVILPDEQSPPPDAIRLETPASVDLEPGEQTVIRGWFWVPNTDANFHTFGVLVKDLGHRVDNQRRPNSQDGKSRIGIRFVTQYLLRCDVSVTNSRSPHVAQLQVQSAELVEENGHPRMRAWLFNPTDSTVEFSARGLLTSPGDHARRRPTPLVLPVRAGLQEPERHVARILPKARVRMDELLPTAVFPGQHELTIELLGGHRAVARSAFPISVDSGDFPAQEIAVVQAAPGISVAPGQLELSLGRGGRRFLPLTIHNNSAAEAEVALVPETLEGRPCEWFVVRPDTVSLLPGRRRTVIITVGNQRDGTQHRYCALRIETSAAGSAEPVRLPLAVLGSADAMPQVDVGELGWTDGELPTFVIPVSNRGSVHIPLDATLAITDVRGRSLTLSAGFGRWLLPGQSEELRFLLKQPLTPGIWELRATIRSGDKSEPVERHQVIQIGPPAEE